MTDKDLHRLRRGELLEILLEQSKENDNLRIELEEKNKLIEELNKKLEDRRIDLQEAGTIAEASFKLNGVFDAAEKAAKQYLDNLQELYERETVVYAKKEKEVETRCAVMLQTTQENCNSLKAETEKNCAELETVTRQKCLGMEAEITKRCNDMEMSVTEKCKLLEADTKKKCEEMTAVTDYKCHLREKEAEEKCIALDLKAKEDVDKRWNELSVKLEDFYNAHQGIRELLSLSKIDTRE